MGLGSQRIRSPETLQQLRGIQENQGQNLVLKDFHNWQELPGTVGSIIQCSGRKPLVLAKKYYSATTHSSDWWGSPNYTEPNPRSSKLPWFKDQLGWLVHWRPLFTPEGFYWICAANTHSVLPANWSGAWILGLSIPSFSYFPTPRWITGSPSFL